MHKRSSINSSFILAGILATVITPVVRAASDSSSKNDSAKTAAVERSFQAVIVSADPVRHTIRVRHKPTDYETDVVWDEKSSIRVSKSIDVDEVPEGWVECVFKKVDPELKAVFRFYQIESLPESKAPKQADPVKAQTKFRCKLIRVPATLEMRKNHTRLLTRDEKCAYALEVNGEIWSVYNTTMRYLGREFVGSTADLVPGMDCRTLI